MFGTAKQAYLWPLAWAGAVAALAALGGSGGVAVGQTGPVFLTPTAMETQEPTPTPIPTETQEPTPPPGGGFPFFLFPAPGVAATPTPTATFVPTARPTSIPTPTPFVPLPPVPLVGSPAPAATPSPTAGQSIAPVTSPTSIPPTSPEPAVPGTSSPLPPLPLGEGWGEGAVAICHLVEAGPAPFALIQVPEAEVASHLVHGDVFPERGGCPPLALVRDPRYFAVTGFRVSDEQFFAYFRDRGGLRAFGPPISRRFVLEGAEVQLFELRGIQRSGADAGQLDILGGERFPYGAAGGLTLPFPDPEVATMAPPPGDPDYLAGAAALVNAVVPDDAFGLPVGFRRAYADAARYEEIFPDCVGEEGRAGCPGREVAERIALDLWGLPTSRPAVARTATADAQTTEAVCQRFERGILCHDVVTEITAPLPLGASLKAILMGQGLPDDLRAQSGESRFYGQYDPAQPMALARPEELAASDLTNAFEAEALPRE